MNLPVAILMSARWLVPSAQRAEWFAEWDAELCYIRRVCNSRALAFCLGAYKDAFWLRRQCPHRLLNSPLHCLALLAMVAAIALMSAGRAVLASPFRDARGLVDLPDMSCDRYEAIRNKADPLSADFAFYQRIGEPVGTAHGTVIYSVIRGTGNLLEVLNVPAANSAHRPVLILSRKVWQMDFDGDRHIAGRVLEIGERRVPVAGVIAEDAWPLAGRVDAWLLDDEVPPDSRGSIVGRASASGSHRPPRRIREFVEVFVMAMIGCLIVAATTSLTLGVAQGIRPWAFLLTKAALLVPAVYSCALLSFSADIPFTLIFHFAVFPGSVLAFHWAVTDQRRRCPVCLRLLSNEVLLGKASQTFLGWYGTESMCARGHGVLRVPEIVTSCSGSQQWVNLEQLCEKVSG